MITISNLNLILKQTHILKDVSFTLHSGEILGITGHQVVEKAHSLNFCLTKKTVTQVKLK
jgi:ABC-type cobalamin/Fe3+-siderophores transport system ATPase subunit